MQARSRRLQSVTTCVLAVLTAAVIAGCAKPAADREDTGLAMRGTAAGLDSLRQAYAETYNRHDAATLASYYADDAVAIQQNGMLSDGRAAIQASWPQDTALWGSITITPTKPATIVDNVAWEVGTVAIQMAQRGRTMTIQNRYLVLLQHDGSWKLKATAGVADSAAMAAARRPAAR